MLLKRLALIPLGLLLGLALLEGGLQIVAWLVQRTTRGELPSSWVTGNVRVLCIGDSNTYGLYLERHETYPSQLEALWNERIESSQLEVLNLGFPGTNSSRVVRDFPRLLETFAPDIVILMVGVNDFWTQPFPLEEDGPQIRRGFLQRHSLIYRGLYLLRRALDAREVEIVMDRDRPAEPPPPTPDQRRRLLRRDHRLRYGVEEFEMGFVAAKEGLRGDRESLVRNLRTLVAQAEQAEIRLYLMSYPARDKLYTVVNPTIREIAQSTDAPFVDLTAVFQGLCPERECPEFLFADGHPNAAGYRIVAETLVGRLSNQLRR